MFDIYLYFKVFAVGFLVTTLFTPVMKKVAFRIGATDAPGERKMHSRVMARLGGPAVFIGFLFSVLMFIDISPELDALLLAGALILMLGIYDDMKGISPKVKLLGQTVAALIVAYQGISINFISIPFDGFIYLGAMTIPFTVLWLVGVTNAINLIDGLDGLASGVTAIALVTFAVMAFGIEQYEVSIISFALAACVFGFLRYNFFPAKIFLGDSGSMFLGFNVAALAVYGLLKGVTVVAFVIPIVVLGVPIFDTLFAIVRRYFSKEPIFQADKKHLHHRLIGRGLTHRQAVVVIYMISIIFSASALWFTRSFYFFF